MNKAIFLILLALFTSRVSSQESQPDVAILCPQISKIIKDDRLYRDQNIFDKNEAHKFEKKTLDSLKNLQWSLDNKNTEALIEIIQTYGWLNKKRLPCDFDPIVFIPFRHSQPVYHTEIKILMDKALAKGRLSKFHYDFLNDHFKGRPKG